MDDLLKKYVCTQYPIIISISGSVKILKPPHLVAGKPIHLFIPAKIAIYASFFATFRYFVASSKVQAFRMAFIHTTGTA